MTPEQAARQALKKHLPHVARTLTPLTKIRRGEPAVFAVGAALVMKVWPDLTRAARQAERQMALARSPAPVPEVLFFDATLGVMAMRRVSGTSAADLWQREGDFGVLERAATWLAAFHKPTLRQAWFSPDGHLRWLARLQNEAEKGQRHVPLRAQFDAEVARMTALAPKTRKRRVLRAVTHRDLHLSNLVMNDVTWGLDFENSNEDDAIRDIGSLAIDAARLRPDLAPAAIFSALRAAYRDAFSKPAPRLFLQRGLALQIWANTPDIPSRRQAARFDVARWLLAQDDAVL